MNNWEHGLTGAMKVSVAFLPICDQFRIGKCSDLNFKECDISSHDEVLQVDQF